VNETDEAIKIRRGWYGNIKRYLLEIRRENHITLQQLFEQCNIHLKDIYTVEIGGCIDTKIAQKVLAGFNELGEQHLTIADIHLNLPRGQRAPSTLIASRSD
jgi:hypothetical protein